MSGDASYYNSQMPVNFLRSHRTTVCRITTGDFVATGDARCDPEDTYDIKTGDAVAFARALESLAVKYRKLAQARMNTQLNDRQNRAKAREWHREQAGSKEQEIVEYKLKDGLDEALGLKTGHVSDAWFMFPKVR
jgi:Domain of unknown function (DUF1876)